MDIGVDTSNFYGVLSGSDDNVQEVADTIDDVTTDSIPEGATNKYLNGHDFSGDVTGPYNATVVGNDSHTHTSATIADEYLLNSGDTATGDYSFASDTLFVDSSNGRIGIGTNTPRGLFELSAPSQTAQYFTETIDQVTYGFGALGGFFKIRSLGSFWGGTDLDFVRMGLNTEFNQLKANIDVIFFGDTAEIARFDAGTDSLDFDDNKKLKFGTGADSEIYFNNTNLIIDPDVVGTGKLLIGKTGDDTISAGSYEAGGVAGITDNTSYWLCTAADCSSRCQLTITSGLITGCP